MGQGTACSVVHCSQPEAVVRRQTSIFPGEAEESEGPLQSSAVKGERSRRRSKGSSAVCRADAPLTRRRHDRAIGGHEMRVSSSPVGLQREKVLSKSTAAANKAHEAVHSLWDSLALFVDAEIARQLARGKQIAFADLSKALAARDTSALLEALPSPLGEGQQVLLQSDILRLISAEEHLIVLRELANSLLRADIDDVELWLEEAERLCLDVTVESQYCRELRDVLDELRRSSDAPAFRSASKSSNGSSNQGFVEHGPCFVFDSVSVDGDLSDLGGMSASSLKGCSREDLWMHLEVAMSMQNKESALESVALLSSAGELDSESAEVICAEIYSLNSTTEDRRFVKPAQEGTEAVTHFGDQEPEMKLGPACQRYYFFIPTTIRRPHPTTASFPTEFPLRRTGSEPDGAAHFPGDPLREAAWKRRVKLQAASRRRSEKEAAAAAWRQKMNPSVSESNTGNYKEKDGGSFSQKPSTHSVPRRGSAVPPRSSVFIGEEAPQRGSSDTKESWRSPEQPTTGAGDGQSYPPRAYERAAQPPQQTAPPQPPPSRPQHPSAERSAVGESVLAMKILDLHPNFTLDELRRAYKKSAMRWHPDRPAWVKAGPEEVRRATAEFQKAKDAFDLLFGKKHSASTNL